MQRPNAEQTRRGDSLPLTYGPAQVVLPLPPTIERSASSCSGRPTYGYSSRTRFRGRPPKFGSFEELERAYAVGSDEHGNWNRCDVGFVVGRRPSWNGWSCSPW